MDYDLGYFDLETRVLEPLENAARMASRRLNPGKSTGTESQQLAGYIREHSVVIGAVRNAHRSFSCSHA